MEESKSANRLTIFKYNAILSILFFLSSTFYMGVKTTNYSFTDYTISQMSYFLNKDQLSIFNLLFFIKCFLDLSFAYYVFKFYSLRLKTLPAINLLIAILSFGLLGFFPANQFHLIHLIIFITTFFSSIFTQFTLAKLTRDEGFINFSKLLILFESILGNLFLFFNYFNAISETTFLLLIFLWLTIFIGRYLK
ncbi:MAG: DUF998 domain-containing protein [Patescibacteria group bacterium]